MSTRARRVTDTEVHAQVAQHLAVDIDLRLERRAEVGAASPVVCHRYR
jgi:hypothetical protein